MPRSVHALLCTIVFVLITNTVFAAAPSKSYATVGLLDHLPAYINKYLLNKDLGGNNTVFPAGNAVQWTGAVDSDWNNPGNWTSLTGTPNIPPQKGSLGDHVIIPDVSMGSGNFPVVATGTAGARSITLQAGASLTVNVGATLEVVGSDADGFTNAGLFTNQGTVLVDSAYNDAFVNQLNAQIINTGAFTLRNGLGNRLINYGSISNNTVGNFMVNQGVDTALINFPGASILNQATFNVSSGTNVRIYNLGSINNTANFTVGGGSLGHGLVNATTGTISNSGTFQIREGFASQLINYGSVENLAGNLNISGGGGAGVTAVQNFSLLHNHTGASMRINSGRGPLLVNDSLVINDGTASIGSVPWTPMVLNNTGDSIISRGNLSITGGAAEDGSDTYALENFGYIEFSGSFSGGGFSNRFMLNAGTFIGKPSGVFSVVGLSQLILHNSVTGKLQWEGESNFNGAGSGAILNEGHFKYKSDSTFSIGSLGGTAIINHNYMELEVDLVHSSSGPRLFINTDSLLLGPQMNISSSAAGSHIENSGYFLNQADLKSFTPTGNGAITITNSGLFIHDETASYIGKKLPGDRATILNQVGGRFISKGDFDLDEGRGIAFENHGYWHHTGNIKVSNFNGLVNFNAIVNTDTLINDGLIELDTLYNEGIDNSKYLRNGPKGKIYADYVRKNGMYNTGEVYNFGEIWMARDTGIGQAGIYNAQVFDNNGLINIGQTGPLFGGGIVNDGAGVFNNRSNAYIVIANVDSTAILNKGATFNNGLCALIDVSAPILDQNNSFTNDGIIVQRQDTLELDANILTNTGKIYDLDSENFVITNQNGQVLASLPPGGVLYYLDADGDGFGNPDVLRVDCVQPEGYVSDNSDCDDSEDEINPDATEICDGIDNNCNGVADEGCTVPMASIHDPCTCVNNSPVVENGTTTNAGTFSETVTVEATTGQTWRIVNVRDLYSDINATIPYTMGMIIPETGVGTGVYELAGYHYDGVGYAIEVTNGDTILSIDNKCFYPDPVFTGLPALVAPTAAPFQVTGTVANNAAGTGTFLLDGVAQPGASPAPTVVTINPATLSVGTHTLEYSFDADTAASKDPSNPGCVQVVRQRFQVAHCGCQDVTVSLDGNCQFVLVGNLVSDANCGGGTVRVMDNNPSNGNIIDCAGVWTYGLFDSFGNIICWGKVTAEDKTGPQLLCPTAPVAPLACYDVSYVLNNRLTIGNPASSNNASPRLGAAGPQTISNAEGVRVDETLPYICSNLTPPNTTGDAIKNLGYPYYKDNCYNPVPSAQYPNCGCRTSLKWSDKVRYLSCTDPLFLSRRVYAIIEREWVATDCNGMLGDPHTQIIEFVRPLTTEFSFKDETRDGVKTMSGVVAKTPGYDWVVEYSSCTPNESLITKKDVTPSHCSFFNTSGNPRCLYIDEVECNYSVSIKDTKFPICGGKGVKIDRELYVFDWCAGKIVDTFHILIKIGDFQAPTCEYAHGAPFDVSTGPMDCMAAIPVTLAGIKSVFGVTIKDNCDNIANVSVKVYTKDRYVKGILVAQGNDNPFYCAPTTAPARQGAELRSDHDSYRKTCARVCWDSVDYAVMNGMMIGLPVGRYLMKIDAFDGCYNAGQCCFIFDVKDKIAPVMKCDDDLHITLSNANGYTNGYAQVSAADIDEGSWDNCKMGWIGVRRNVPDACAASFIAKGYDTNGNGKLDAAVGKDLNSDGDFSDEGESLEDGADGYDRNGDGDLKDFGETFVLKGGKLMTPIQDEVEFFCCDLAERVTIELWGEDFAGNRNYCWNDVLIEDKVAPTCVAPWNTTIDCDDKNIALIDDREASSKIWGDVTITSGSDCANLAVVYSTVKTLKCGYGKIVRKWAITKETAKGPVTIGCEQTIYVHPKHEYDIRFPKDASTDCKTPSPDTVIVDELACDLLAVNVTDKRYEASEDECYKIFRTYTVMNWCAYDDRCGDPMATSNIFVVDRRTFTNDGKNPLYVLVRDRDYKVRLRDATSNPYTAYTDNGLNLTGNQYGALSPSPSTSEVKEFNSSSTEYEFKRDHVEEFWISADGTVGNSSTFANGDNDGDSNNNTKRDLLVTQKMPYCPIAFSGNNNQTPVGEFHHSFMYTQIIKVYDDVRPVVSAPAAEFCIREGADCLADIKITVSATDNCADKLTLERQYLMIAPLQTTDASKMISYPTSTSRWTIKELANNQFEISVTGIGEGTHDLLVVVRDECGNLSVATRIPFTVKDCKGPAPICINGLSTELMSDGADGGMMAVWASDFVASKIYDCNGQGPETSGNLKLVTKYSINRVGEPVVSTQTGINLTCADKGKVVLVELHAWDNVGNHDFCVTYVEVQDNRSVCPGSLGTVNIAGTISTEGAGNLQSASVTLSGAASQSANTNATGGYSFINLTKGGDFTVTPQLDKNHLNGVSTFDLVLIQKHILGVQALNSPYKMIAADVNNSKSITTLDLIALRKLILNIDTHFANNTSWRFVDAAYNFPNASNPWSVAFPEVVSVNDLANNVTANFIAIKVGDVNASASVNDATSAETRTSEDFKLKTQEQHLKSGNEYKITFTANDLKNIQGYQFALNLDQSKVELLDIEYGVAKAENFGIFKNEGLVTTSWNAKYEPGALFTLILRAKVDSKLSQSLSLNRLIHPEAYDQNSEYMGVKLTFEGEQISESYELKQNIPNPFGAETSIGFSLPKAAKATLRIRDVRGALIYKVEGRYAKGSNQITLKKEQLGASGVLYYTLETNDFTATKKMVLLHE